VIPKLSSWVFKRILAKNGIILAINLSILPKANKYLCSKQHGVKMFINNKRGICLKQRIFFEKENVVTRLKFDL